MQCADDPHRPADDAGHAQSAEVVVVGAGLAGLAAAVILRRFSVGVTVVEARARTGGRACTVQLDADTAVGLDHAKVEKGASYLHTCGDARQQPLFELCARLRLPSVPAMGDDSGRLWGWAAVELADWPRLLERRKEWNGDAGVVGEWVDAQERGRLGSHCIAELVVLFEQAMAACCVEARDAAGRAEHLPLGPVFDAAVESLIDAQHAAGLRSPLCAAERQVLRAIHTRRNGYVRKADDLPLSEALRAPWPEAMRRGFHDEPSFSTSPIREEHVEHLTKEIETRWQRAAAHACRPSCEPTCLGEDRLLLPGGFGRIVEWLQHQLLDVRPSKVVRQVAYSHDTSKKGDGVWRCCVEMHTPRQPNGSECPQIADGQSEVPPEKIACRAVIVTVPPGVLAGLDARSLISFEPSLSPERLAALRRLAPQSSQAPTHEKVLLRFASADVFWPKEAPLLASPDPHLCFENLDHYQNCEGQLVVHIWPGGEICVDGRDDACVVDAILGVLGGMFPEASNSQAGLPRPRQAKVSRWASDPYALGAYAAGGIGLQPGDWAAAAAPLPDEQNPGVAGSPGSGVAQPAVLFAGEHCAQSLRQTTAGAFVSGASAALRLLRFLRPAELSPADEERIRADLAAFLWPRDPRLML